MPISTHMLINFIEELSPKNLALDWDNVGLQVGGLHGTAKKVLVTLDVDEHVVQEAISLQADFIISHHPLIFRPLETVRTDLPQGRALAAAVSSGIRIYVAHTNLDIARGGVNDVLAANVGLQETQVLRVTGHDFLQKIVVFVPSEHEKAVRDAMSKAGAGWVGNYSDCYFSTDGTGFFMPREGTDPFIGKEGTLEQVEEKRLETIVPRKISKRVISAMLRAHPYEEAAYDVYPLANEGVPYGLGRVGTLTAPCTLAEYILQIKEALGMGSLCFSGEPERLVKRVAVCGGSGGDLVPDAVKAGADLLITGDIKYHEAREAQAAGLALIDAGHETTERPVLFSLAKYLKAKVSQGGYQTEVVISTVKTSPWKTL